MSTSETISETTTNLSSSLPLADDDVDHWVCCIDENITYCGKNGSHLTSADFEIASCMLCEIARTSIEHSALDKCPLFPNFKCPD